MTVDSPEMVDRFIAGNGYYPGDENHPQGPAVRIVQYTNAWGKRTHGVVFEADARAGQLHRYEQVSEHISDPVVVWTRAGWPAAPARAS
jgi:hypothetical protein